MNSPYSIKLTAAAAAAVVFFSISVALTQAPPARPATRATLRAGVYDSRAVCVGSRNFPAVRQQRDKQMADLQRQLKESQAAGDEKRAAQIKQRGSTLQDVAHLKAFSNAPVDDILLLIQDQLPRIAQEAGVDVIVARVDFQAPGVEVVDVTDRLVAAFDPDEKTLKIVEDLRKTKPLDMAEVLLHHD